MSVVIKARAELIGGPKDGDIITVVFKDKVPREVSVDEKVTYYLVSVAQYNKDIFAKYEWRYDAPHQ